MNHRFLAWLLGLLAFVVVLGVARRSVRSTPEVSARSTAPADLIPDDNFRHLFATLSPQGNEAAASCAWLDRHWQSALVAPLLELFPFASQRESAERIARLIELHTGSYPLPDTAPAWQWLWRTNAVTLSGYAEFKGDLYSGIDSRFREYFVTGRPATIRLDEVRWGGVRRDGIPPLRNPKMLPADEAAYLADSNVVFGIEFNRDVRAYPKRILAWHEMVTDAIGGEDVCLVYCTLCGSVIPYRATAAGVHHELGTSGFLYRSNKLMYDAATKSLWNTLTGEPVVGPLVGRGIRLEVLPIVTTTWGEWRRRHPETTVLSLETGHRRDYDEGVAYADYFATDDLMFPVPELDLALKNKAEILTVRIPGVTNASLVFAADFLIAHPVHHAELAETRLVILTDATGANRVYSGGDTTFVRWDGSNQVIDTQGGVWSVREDLLTSTNRIQLARLPAHRAFWFGWRAIHPETRVLK